jgi:hypothetical protein
MRATLSGKAESSTGFQVLHIGHNAPACNFTVPLLEMIIADVLIKLGKIAQPSLEKMRDAAPGWGLLGASGARKPCDVRTWCNTSKTTRTSQIVFGERQHLLRVLDSLEGTDLPLARGTQERRSLEELIHARTRELNQINTAWDEKIGLVLSADAKPEMLEKLVKQAPETDFYLLRLISEHPRANAKTLNKLAKHPYGAIRENVARHPNADANTLTYLSRDRSQPLWYLVAFNPNTPTTLQRRLRDRLKRLGETHVA